MRHPAQKVSTTSRRRDSQGGYALLMVFLMAAIVALTLYQQLPRVAFESEREKEQLLIDRGEQYTRAIQLYYLANNRQWPTSIDDLEKKEKRFLRRRYVDPYTGKDDWRIIHTTGGFLTDSLVQKPPGTSDSQNQSASNAASPTSNTTTDGQPQVNAAVLLRPSDRPLTPTPGFAPPAPPRDPSAQPGNTSLPPITLQPQQGPGALPPITLQPQQGPGALPPITLQAGGGNQPGLPPITLAPTGPQGGQQVPGQIPTPGAFRAGGGVFVPPPGQAPPGGLSGGIQTGVPPGFRTDANGQLVPITPVPGQGIPGQIIPGQGGQIIPGQIIPGQVIPAQPQGIPGQFPAIPGQTFSPQPGQTQTQFPNQPSQQFQNQPAPNQPGSPPGSPNAALNLINQLLTNPRQTPSTPALSGGNQVGGIAGIASTYKGPSIKVYKDQSRYELWEFVFTPTASTVPAGVGGPNGPGNQPGVGNQIGGPNQPGAGNQPGNSGLFAPGR